MSETAPAAGRLSGKVAFLAGATGGIGRTIAEVFAQEGARVVVGGRRRAEGQEVVEAIGARGGEAIYVSLDVTSEESVSNAVRAAVDTFGSLDVLVNNAGGSTAADGRVTTASIEEFWNKINVELFGTFLCNRVAIPELIASGGGSVINMASLAGLGLVTDRDAYSSAKGAVLTLTQSTAREFAADRVRVNAIAPAGVRTERIVKLLEASSVARATMARQVMGMIEPVEIAYAAVFLASDESRSLTGQILTIHGGYFG
ncbi:SDR family oxidoreductase [Rugosimonospora acidiphila]|uniref:SDR family oxidoreductase n=1 Tax=Rugosimonospora acidiphila TaxID=556531 RepID=A0ABP9RP19_9ACTN